ncbi:choice-of-anchor D domain-containing protein [Bacteroidota bacterium]
MKKIIISVILFMIASQIKAQPEISYIIPDIGAPGMSTYLEIIGPFNPEEPMESSKNFGSDAFQKNNQGSPYRVRCANAVDEWKVTFGPCIVSWDGRMISTQVFVNSLVIPNSADWEALDPEFRIPILVETAPGTVSNIDTFYIVQPWKLGNVGGIAERILGEGQLGKRSRRGAMLVDSLTLANATYTVSTKNCDVATPGNQGYLPFVLLSKGKITGGPNTIINVSGQRAQDSHGGNGGPGGGGGGGRFCDNIWNEVNGDNGGSGFVSGGRGGYNKAGNPTLKDKLELYGEGTRTNGWSINGIIPPRNSPVNYEASGGGTGHPFGRSGVGTADGKSDNPIGGYGGGSGFRDNKNGGSGGFATKGANSMSAISVSGGKTHGNDMVVPIAGGSGGGSGNPNPSDGVGCSGSAGGGGGSIKIFAPFINNIALQSNGANGLSGSDGDDTRGGSGSGGYTGICSKLALNTLILQVEGGKDQDNDVNGGAGRMRFDLPSWNIDNTNIPPDASKFRGPTTDTSQFVKRQFTLNGSRGDNKNILVYLKPESGNWQNVSGVTTNGNAWQLDLDLTGDVFCNDSIFYTVVFQEVDNPVKDIALHTYDPDYVMSQAGTNIFRIVPDIQGDDEAQMHITVCEKTETDTVRFVIKNAGGPSLNLKIDSSYFDALGNGIDFNGFKLVDPDPVVDNLLLLSSCESRTFTVIYTYQQGHYGSIATTLFIPHNDSDPARNNPWEVNITVAIDSFALASLDSNGVELDIINNLDLGQICLGDSAEAFFEIKNISSLDVNLLDFEFSDDEIDKFLGGTVSTNFIQSGDVIQAYIKFNNPDAVRQYRTRVYIKPEECESAIDSFDVYVDIVENMINFSQDFIIVDTVHFGQVKVGYSKNESVDVTNDGTGQALIRTEPEISPTGEFSVTGTAPNLPVLLTPMDGSKLTVNIDFTPTVEGPHSARMTVVSDDSDNPLSCPADGYVILFGEGIKSEVTAYPIDFGLLANCQGPVIDTIVVKNSGAASVQVISSGEILGADKNYFRLINPPAQPYTLSSSDSSLYFVEFDPSIPPTGQKSATFHLLTDDNFEPDIYAKISAESDSVYVIVDPDFISFGGVPVPKDKSESVVITNNGRFDVVIDRVEINDPLVSISPDPAGMGLAPGGGSVNFDATVSFTEFRAVDAEVRVILSEPCDDTLIIIIRGRGLEGEWSYPTDLDFGEIAFCESSTMSFDLVNLGDPPIEIRKMERLQEDDWQFFTLQGPEPDGLILNRDDSYSRDIIFKPENTTEGVKTAKLQTVIFVNAKEDTLITILKGTRASGLLSLPDEVDFGKVIVSITADQQLKLVNIGTRVITINSITPLTKYPGVFKIDPDQLMVPLNLSPGDTAKFDLEFTPDNVQFFVDTLEFTIISPCPETRRIILRGEGIPALSASVWLPKVKVLPTERNYKIPLLMRLEERGEEVSGISIYAKIIFNASLFLPRSVSNNGSLISSFIDGDGNRIIEISADNLDINDNDSVLTEIIGDILLGNVQMTPLEWDTLYISPDTIFAPILPEDGELNLIICREGQPRLLRSAEPTMLMANPNPASSVLTISGNVLESGLHRLELVDIRGNRKHLYSWEVDDDKVIDYIIDLQGLSSGMYYLILRSPARIKAVPVFIIN